MKHSLREPVGTLGGILTASLLGPSDGSLPMARPRRLFWQAILLYTTLVLFPTLLIHVLLPTPRGIEETEGHVVVVVSGFIWIIWMVLTAYFFNLFRLSWHTEPRVAMVLGVLTLDSLRNVLEGAYFAVAYSGWIHLIPLRYMGLLWKPQAMIVSRLMGLATAMLILLLVMDRGFESLRLREQRSILIEQRNRELDALQQLAALVSETLDHQGVLDRVCREIVETLEFRSVLLWLVDAPSGQLYGAAGWGIAPEEIASARCPLDSSVPLVITARRGELQVLSDDPSLDVRQPERNGTGRENELSAPVRVLAPIGDPDASMGVIDATVDSPAPDAHRLALLQSFLRHASTAIRNARLHEIVVKDRERLNDLTTTLEDRNNQLESFVYMVSHDLKAPIVSIQGFLSLMVNECGGALGEEGQFYLERVRRNTEHLNDLIRQLLDLSRAGRLDTKRQPVQMAEMVKEVLDVLSLRLQQSGARVEVEEPLPPVMGDPIQVKQLLVNLLDNSIKYLGDSPERFIRLSEREVDGEVEIVIRDSGVGIPEEFHERVFQMFQRVGGPGRDVEGSGVGLAVVRKIAEGHGGRAWTQTPSSGRGAEFHVRLPAASARASRESPGHE